MEQFFRKLFWFLVVVIALNLAYLLMLVFWSPGFKKIYEISRFEKQNYETIVLGNSMALDGIDAEYLSNKGMSTYNLSVAGNHISTSVSLLKDYLEKNDKPKMVVVGLSSAIGKSYLNPVPFTNPEVEFFYHPSLISNLKNPPLLNFQWLAVDLLKIVISKDHRNATMVLGQWKTKKVIPDGSVFKNAIAKPIDYRDPFLLEITKICQEQGIKLVVVELPGSNSNQNNLPFQYTVKLKDGTSQMVYNLNSNAVGSQVLNPATDWLAQDHLNQFGGQKITTFLLEQVFQKNLNSNLSSQDKP
ncbi:MAG: hypothetical protein IPP30_03695 [Flavobacterium sp.]|nr:hypothetical protein [Flavobacterium sp.]